MKLWLLGVEFAGDSTYYIKKISRDIQRKGLAYELVVNKNGEREHTSDGVWKLRSKIFANIWGINQPENERRWPGALTFMLSK